MAVWSQFLDHPTAYSRPFIDAANVLIADELFWYTDSSKNPELGFGAICYDQWMCQQWDSEFIKQNDPSISYLKLFALVASVIKWGSKFSNRRIILFCDNIGVIHMVNSNSSNCKNCMVLIRKLVLSCMVNNLRVFCRFVRTEDNGLADSLSRMKMGTFWKLANKLSWSISVHKEAVPEELWPMTKLWLK